MATDQPFDTVDSEEFRSLLSYAHHPAPSISIPQRDAVKRRIMKMGTDGIAEMKQMFSVSPVSQASHSRANSIS